MPTEKRERQRAGREARRAAARAAQRRAQRRRQIITVLVLVGVIFGIGLALNLSGDDEGTDVAAGEGEGTSTTLSAEFGDTPCPPADASEVEKTTSFSEAPANCLQEGEDYRAVVETDVGSFTIDLHEDDAPATVSNFVFLARYRAYEDVPFHRVIPGFVVQGGDVEKGDGTGGPGYQFADELPEQGAYELGSVAMANSGPNTNGSQFFVITGDQGVQLPPNYSLFGKVTDGFEEVVKKIEADGSPSGTPNVVHKIVKVTIETA